MQPGANKRQKEMARLEHQKQKALARAERRKEKAERPQRDPGAEDPDIAGIVVGPQPPPEF